MIRARFVPVWVVLALAAAALACGGSVEPTATPLPRPTQRPQSTATLQPTAAVGPTEAVPTRTPGSAEAPVIGEEPWDHPSGAFSIRLPDGWDIEEQDNSVFVTAPDDVSSIEVLYINVGVEFDEAMLNAFIEAVEENWFGGFADYERGDFELQADGSIGVFKTLTYNDVEQNVFSYYWQEGTVVYEEDFWVTAEAYDLYVDGLLEVANSIETDPEAGAEAEPYAIRYTFTGPNDYFEFSVPTSWAHTVEEDGDKILDRFAAPDDASYVENITYEVGELVEGDAAAELARELLLEHYGLEDLEITDQADQEDGSVRLSWFSAEQGIDGESFYETRDDTAFLLLTWIVDSDSFDRHRPVWTGLIDSYAIPEAEGSN
jgi:hypothetical protein